MKKIERVAVVSVLVLVAIFGVLSIGLLVMQGQVGIQTTGAPLAALQPSATSTPKPKVSCPATETEAYIEELTMVMEDWDDLMLVANATPRMSLPSVVRELQEAKRDAHRMARPACADYLQELVVVAMEREIDGLIAFLGQESDTIVQHKMQGANRAREIVDAEIKTFREDPLAAYMASNTTAEELESDIAEATSFTFPEGWQNINLVDDENLILSMPGGWTAKPIGTKTPYTGLQNEDGMLSLAIFALSEPWLTEFESDAGRLFALQTLLETSGYDYYNEWRSETGIYASNRGYLVEFAKRYSFENNIEREVWVVVITPEGREVMVQMSTNRDEFAQIDYILMETILKSIRSRDQGTTAGTST